MNSINITSGYPQEGGIDNTALLLLLESLENDPEVLAVAARPHNIPSESMSSLNKKIAKLKVANRMYSLRNLEIFHVPESTLTKGHIEKAKKQVRATRECILPIAEQCLLRTHLGIDIERVEKRISEVELLFAQRKNQERVTTTLVL